MKRGKPPESCIEVSGGDFFFVYSLGSRGIYSEKGKELRVCIR